MDRAVRAAMVFCDHRDRGCTALVPYYELASHLRSCRFAPCCLCPSRACPFSVSPAALPEHFSELHNWRVVHDLVYGQPCELAFPDPDSMVALVSEADGCVFVVYALALGGATVVWLVRMRASAGDAPEVAQAHRFHCQLWVQGGGNNDVHVFSSFWVTSSDGSRLPDDQGLFLDVPLLQLLHDEYGEPPALMIRIRDHGEQCRRRLAFDTRTPRLR